MSGIHANYVESPVLGKISELYHELLEHDGFGELKLDIRILKRGQKEVIIHCGKQYRYVVNYHDAFGSRKTESGF